MDLAICKSPRSFFFSSEQIRKEFMQIFSGPLLGSRREPLWGGGAWPDDSVRNLGGAPRGQSLIVLDM